jgi:hypothetical protein
MILLVANPILVQRPTVLGVGFRPVKSQLSGAARSSGVIGILALMTYFGYLVGGGMYFPFGPDFFPIFDVITVVSMSDLTPAGVITVAPWGLILAFTPAIVSSSSSLFFF